MSFGANKESYMSEIAGITTKVFTGHWPLNSRVYRRFCEMKCSMERLNAVCRFSGREGVRICFCDIPEAG